MRQDGLPAGRRKTKLLAHEHSGRLRHHHHTSYGSLLLVLVMAFAVALFVQRSVSAGVGDTSGSGNYAVYGVVPHLPVTTAPQITNLQNGQVRTSNDSLQLSGTCPGNNTVHIYKNDVLAGTTPCHNGSFSLSIDLFLGNNSLTARAYNADGQPGPDSAPLLVTLIVPGIAAAAPAPAGTASSPFYITSDVPYRAVTPGRPIQWSLSVGGGQTPYNLNIDWGDGKTSRLSAPSAGNYAITHTYATSATGAQYTVQVTASDSQGNSAVLQLMSLLPASGQTASVTSVHHGRLTMSWAIAGLAVVTIIVLSFWIGEKRELFLLLHHRKGFA